MSYQVLSRKYRPQCFEDVTGQKHVTHTLQNAIRINRVAHGYLFTGPRGVGKTTVARILVKSLNCVDYRENNPCNACINCQEITEGRSLDVLEIDGASNRGINDIRELREVVKYPPTSGRFRIYIIDEVHMLTREAFNALLKTLEEPPSHVIFIMATTDPHKIPQTILSRTQRFDFNRLTLHEICNHLQSVLGLEDIGFEENTLDVIAQKGDGSMRDSLSLLDQVIAYSDDRITISTVRNVLGIVPDTFFCELMNHFLNSDDGGVLQAVNTLVESGTAIGDFIKGFNSFLRGCLLVLAGKSQLTNLNPHTVEWLESDQFAYTSRDILRMMELVLQFEARMRFMEQPHIALEALFLKLVALDSSVLISQLLSGQHGPAPMTKKIKSARPTGSKVEAPSARIAKPIAPEIQTPEPISQPAESAESPAQAPAPDQTQKKEPASMTIESITENWPRILEAIADKNLKTAHYLENGQPTRIEKGNLVLTLQATNGFELRTLEKDVQLIKEVIQTIMGFTLNLLFVSNVTPGKKVRQKIQTTDLDHPLTVDVIELFNGEILR